MLNTNQKIVILIAVLLFVACILSPIVLYKYKLASCKEAQLARFERWTPEWAEGYCQAVVNGAPGN